MFLYWIIVYYEKGVVLITDFITEVKSHFPSISKVNGLTTGKVRSVSSKLLRSLNDKSIDNVFKLCEQLLNEREWALSVIAYDWAYRVRNQYNDKTFQIFEKWLKEYVTGGGSCDDLCTHAFGELLSQNNALFQNIIEWTRHPDFFVRRASAVILINPIKQGKYQGIEPFQISDILMHDSHDLVLKGYGWMLKVLSEAEPNSVYEYLLLNKKTMPRVSFRYALEKLDKNMEFKLMEG